MSKISYNLPDYLLLISALTAIYGAGIYYIYALNLWSIVLIIALIIGSFYFLHKPLFGDSSPHVHGEKTVNHYLKYWPYLIYFLFYFISLYILYTSQSARAIVSPWQVIKPGFFIFYTLCSLTLVIILIRTKLSSSSKLIALSAHYFLSFSVAAIIYKIGYGFDPFIHQATMELIDKKGFVTPKPLYYLGEYGLIMFFHKLSGISIYLLNKFLVPVMAAIFLPISIYRLSYKNNSHKSHWLVPVFILIIGFSPFIATTPQNLSYLFLILTIIFGLTKSSSLWPIILATATLAIHPLTGIPAICWCLILFLDKHSSNIKRNTYKLLRIVLFFFSSLVLPLALFISGGNDLKRVSLNFNFVLEPLKNLFTSLSGAGSENWLLNFTYFFSYNYNLWLIILISSLIFFYRQKENKNFKSLIFINLALSIAYLISSQILFTDLINYEQSNFASRLLILITIFFLPFLIFELQKLISLIMSHNSLTKIIWLTFGIGLISISLYVSYPRIDKYFNSRGYSTGSNDIEAVKLIDKWSVGPYIVLANQQVSVAALKEFGFDHYFKNNSEQIFFYPIPTGGKLYTYYLDMVYKNPSRKTMASARDLAGVKESYLIINKYWSQSGKIINEAKLSADSWKEINKEVYIFKYLAD